MSGYPATPLPKKLGIKPGTRLLLWNAPPEYDTWLGIDTKALLVRAGEQPDLIHVFVKDEKELQTHMAALIAFYKAKSDIVIWISWYKRASKIPTDISEDSIRNKALQQGLVDVKVCSVSDEWSGLKLVVPLANRR